MEKKSKVPTGLKKTWSVISTVLKIAIGACATVLLICVVCGFVFAGVLGNYLQEDILPASSVDMEGYDLDQNSFLYYVDGDGEIQILQKIHAKESSQWVSYEDIPEHLINATIAIEDHRFREHQGVDWITTIKACARMFFGDDSVGGSSITQQLIKNILLTEDETADDVTVRRKVMEIFRAVQLEKRYDKETIMEYYLNCIYLGQQTRGVKSAAATYFGKELSQLTVAESASLISITNSPTYYDPYQNFDNNKERKETVLWAMKNYNYITEAEYNQAMAQEIVLKAGIDPEDRMTYCENEECGFEDIRKNFKKAENGTYSCPKCGQTVTVVTDASQDVYSWYTDVVIEDVAQAMAQKEGFVWNDKTKELYTDRIKAAGLHIYTCIDMEVQNQLDEIYTDLKNIPSTRGGQQLWSAMVIIDNRSGDIAAIAGNVGKKEGHDSWNCATDAKRQSGSSIKPLAVYAPGFESNAISPASVIKDLPLNYNNGAWPKNDSFTYDYARTILSGVTSSVNAVAAHTLDKIGTSYSYDFAKNKFRLSTLVDEYVDENGVTHSDKDYSPLSMGAQTWGVTVRDMASAFSTFANKGVYRRGRTFTKVYDRDGNVVLDNVQETEQILSEKTVNYMNYCLVNATKSGTGTEANLSYTYGITTAGKTGTTQDYKDRWYCGFTGYYTAAVWSGFKDPERIRITSGQNNPSAYLFQKVMGPLHSGKSDMKLYDSSNLYGVTMCLDSGAAATSACSKDIRTGGGVSRTAYSVAYKEDMPGKSCNKHVMVEFCVDGVATEYCKHFAEAGADVKFSEKALVKMTESEVQEIRRARGNGLQSIYYQDNYVYLINNNGKDGKWKGFTGKANVNIDAPYVVCTKHTKATWEKYQMENPPEPETEPTVPVTPVTP